MEGRGVAAGFWTWCPQAQGYKNVRTAQGYADVSGRQDITVFAVMGGVDR